MRQYLEELLHEISNEEEPVLPSIPEAGNRMKNNRLDKARLKIGKKFMIMKTTIKRLLSHDLFTYLIS